MLCAGFEEVGDIKSPIQSQVSLFRLYPIFRRQRCRQATRLGLEGWAEGMRAIRPAI